MDVTKSNFKKLLPEILEAIDSSSFLAVDGEFTGLNNGHNITAFDTPKQYYSKIRSGALDFLFVQFGLSVFKQVKGHERYKNKTYVFYLFPEPLNRDAPDCRFLCQASSLTFLAQNGFNFNKLFREGIPYLKQSDEDSLRETLAEKSRIRANAVQSNNQTIPIPKQFQPAVDAAMEKIKVLLSPNFDKEEVHVEKCSAFVRKLVYQTVREELSGKNICVETKNGTLVARRGVSQEQLHKEKQEKAEKEEETIQDAVGFATIIRRIAASRKLIVGHNVLLDLCHMVHRFIDPLPEDYLEFKEMLHTIFPKILDTKYLVSEALSDLIPSSHLPGVVEAIMKSPFELPKIDAEENYSYEIQNEKFHNAGYDAYVTGLSFITALRYLDTSKFIKSPVDVGAIQKYLNKLFLMKIPDAYIDLERRDRSIQINWLSDTTAWVALQDRSSASKVKECLEDRPVSKSPGVIVKWYKRYSASTGTVASSPRPNKRKLSGSAPAITQKTLSTPLPPTGGEGDRISKKRKSSSIELNIGTIFEETENGSEALMDLESCASAEGDKVNFTIDQDWD
ncbi:poly(A)-specific ribonuclease PARN-like isoform X2 [Cimex lectularius]|uniref:Uncharacterized protein n=1 Tax=Cimex lectularius TaxID=79782 RepID=A0A8I6RNA8_CIMLE|nr:poly(A)-specific ribonuclease PARN-like isoform X2 [Cimex lectularius]